MLYHCHSASNVSIGSGLEYCNQDPTPSKNCLVKNISFVFQVVWDSTIIGSKVVFSYFSKDLEEGYPGDLVTTVSYEFTDDNKLLVDFKASTTKKTVVNLTNHSYFNLAGHDGGAEELYKHYVIINADKYVVLIIITL